MAYFDSDFINFLQDLQVNNYREWFHENKKRYEASVKTPFKSFVEDVIAELSLLDDRYQVPASKAMFRIHRDIRFSKDKTAYKTNVSAAFGPNGRKNAMTIGLYLHIEPGLVMLGGGSYQPSSKDCQKIRKHILKDQKRFQKIISDKSFVKYYNEIRGEKYKRAPKEAIEFVDAIPELMNKQFYIMHELSDDIIFKSNFLKVVVDHFKAAQPLHVFLEEALSAPE